MTAICNASLWACFVTDPLKFINLVMGGLALAGLLLLPFLILKAYFHGRSDAR